MAMTIEEQKEHWKINQRNFRERHPNYDKEYYARNREKINERNKANYHAKKAIKAQKWQK